MAGYNDAIDRFLNLRSADLQETAEDAANVASQPSSDAFIVTDDGYNVVINKVYPFSFAYLYDNPENPSQPIQGPRSANFLVTLQTPDLTKPVTNLSVNPGLLMYGVKWDLIDKALPANKWLIDIQIYESLTGAFAGEEYLVWNGNGNSASILVSNTANRWIRVDTRDQDYRKKSVVFGPFKASDPIVVDTVGPDNVTSVTTTSGIDTSGYLGFNAFANISWPAVTGGGIRGYRIRFSNDNGATYSYVDSPGTGTTYKLAGLAIGSTYKIAVATYDEYNNTSSNYVSASDVTVTGTPSVSNFISGGPFQFGVGVGSVSTNKGMYFYASNYWYVKATNSARLKVGGATDNYLLWDGAKFTVDGDISARGGTFTGNIFMSNPSGGKGASIYSGTIDAATGNLTGNGFALNSTGLKVANGANSVTLSAATGAITANAGSIAGWNLSDTTLSKNNIVLNSAGTIQVGSSATSSVYLSSSGNFLMWAGNNTPDANAKFRIGSDGTLYATNAILGAGSTLAGYVTTGTLANYVTTGTLANYVTSAGLTSTLTNYSTSAQIAQSYLPTTNFSREEVLKKLNAGTNGATLNGGILEANTISANALVADYVYTGVLTGNIIRTQVSTTFPRISLNEVSNQLTFHTASGGRPGAIYGQSFGSYGRFRIDSPGAANGEIPYIEMYSLSPTTSTMILSGDVIFLQGVTSVDNLSSSGRVEFNDRIYANSLGVYTGTSAYAVRQVYAGGTGTNETGYLRVNTSSRRFKKNIEQLVEGSYMDLLTQLSPVSYLDRNEEEGSPRAFGLIAEEVAEIQELKDGLVPRDAEGNPGAVHYELVGVLAVMALKEIKSKLESIESRLDALEG
jgi:hypothetical protein